jgi:hypothetical protein
MVYYLGCLRYYSSLKMCIIYALNFLPLMDSDVQVDVNHSQVICKFCILSGMYKKKVDRINFIDHNYPDVNSKMFKLKVGKSMFLSVSIVQDKRRSMRQCLLLPY